MFCKRPVERLSSPRTRLPRTRSASTRCEPMKPAAPVTSQVAGAPLPDASSSGSSCRRKDEDNGLDPVLPVGGGCSQFDDPSAASTPVDGNLGGHVASVDDEPSLLDDPTPVIRTVIGRDDDAISLAQRCCIERHACQRAPIHEHFRYEGIV